jgi:hypothetical protein
MNGSRGWRLALPIKTKKALVIMKAITHDMRGAQARILAQRDWAAPYQVNLPATWLGESRRHSPAIQIPYHSLPGVVNSNAALRGAIVGCKFCRKNSRCICACRRRGA